MAEGFQLKADVRERTGKGAARALRRQGLIPAVIYGDNKPPIPITIAQKEVSLALYGGGFFTNTWQIEVGGQTVTALARDYQLEPVKDKLIHVDFLRVSARSRVTVDVPLSFVGEEESPGLKNDGVLEIVERTISVQAPATRIPDTIEVSVAGRSIGDTIQSSDITLPAEVEFASEEPFPVATITAPVAEVAEEAPEAETEAEAEATAEGEGPGEGEGEGSAEDQN